MLKRWVLTHRKGDDRMVVPPLQAKYTYPTEAQARKALEPMKDSLELLHGLHDVSVAEVHCRDNGDPIGWYVEETK